MFLWCVRLWKAKRSIAEFTASLCYDVRFKLLIPPPADDPNGEGDSSELIKTKAFENGVLALPGTVFFANGRRSAHVRTSFSMLDDEKTDEALRRLGEVVRQACGI